MPIEPQSEPMPSEQIASSGMAGEPAGNDPGLRADVDADAAAVLAAVARMQAADLRSRVTLERLRHALGEMAAALGEAKARAAAQALTYPGDGVDLGMLLDELEHRVDAMLEIAGGKKLKACSASSAMPAAAAESCDFAPIETTMDSDRVPTVSDVVSRLDPDQEPAAVIQRDAREAANGAPTVEMLKSLVEALNASIPPDAPEEPGQAPATSPEAEAAAHEGIEAFGRELARAPDEEAVQVLVPETTECVEDARSADRAEASSQQTVESSSDILETYTQFPETPVQAVQLEPQDPGPDTARDDAEDTAQKAGSACSSPIEQILAALSSGQPEPSTAAEPHAHAVPDATRTPEPETSAPSDVVTCEIDLLASFEKMGALPIMPPEIGTAVIFERRSPPAAQAEPPEPVTADPTVGPAPVAALHFSAADPDQPAADSAVEPADGAARGEFRPPADLLPPVDLTGPAFSIGTVEPAPAEIAAPEAVSLAEPEARTEHASRDVQAYVESESATAPEPLADGERLAASESAPQSEAETGLNAVAGPNAESELDPLPESLAVDLDAEFDPDTFLFGVDVEERMDEEATASAYNATQAPSCEAQAESDVEAENTESPHALPESATPTAAAGLNSIRSDLAAPAMTDPLISIRAMTPEERIALCS